MKIDIDYLKLILNKFVESDTQYINTSNFQNSIDENLEKFAFHWDILIDKGFLVRTDGKFHNLIKRGANYNNNSIQHTFVRLNDFGYKFYEALEEKEFLNKIKTSFKNISMDTLMNMSSKFLEVKVLNAIVG